MFENLKKIINNYENNLVKSNNKDKKIQNLLQLEYKIKDIINEEIKLIEEQEGLKEYLKKNNLENKTYENYLKEYSNQSYVEDSYELSQTYTEYKVFEGYKHFAQNILDDMDISSTQYEYENEIFYIRPYNWRGDIYGGCNCGLEEKLEQLYESLDCNIQKEIIYTKGFHAKNCKDWNIVFCYKPTGLKIKMEDTPLMFFENCTSNHPLNEEILRGILNHCKNSISN